MKKVLVSLVTVLFGFTLAGCNTMAGIDKDVERAGEAVQSAAKK